MGEVVLFFYQLTESHEQIQSVDYHYMYMNDLSILIVPKYILRRSVFSALGDKKKYIYSAAYCCFVYFGQTNA